MKRTPPDPRVASRLALVLYCRQYRMPRAALVERLLDYDASQHQDADQLRGRQERLLLATLEHAAARVPYYRELLAARGLTPRDLATIELLRRLPILARKSLLDVQPKLWAEDASKEVRFAHSGGTSGPAVHTPHDLASRLSAQAARGRALGWCGAAPWDRHAFLVSQRFTPIRRLAVEALDRLLRRRRNATATFELADAATTLRRFARFKPALLIGQASLVFRLAHFGGVTGIDTAQWGTRAALVNGEPLTPYMESIIRGCFKCDVVDEYGCTEVGSIAHRCPAGTYHLNPEHVIVELVDDAGMAVGPGVAGRVILTGLHNRAMPMIRYEVGDVAMWADRPCPCGRQPALIGLRAVAGRSASVWRDPNGHAMVVQDCVAEAQRLFADAGFWNSQWVQQVEPRDTIDVRVEPNEPPPAALLAEAGRKMTEQMHRPITIAWTGHPVEWTRGGKLSSMFRAAT